MAMLIPHNKLDPDTLTSVIEDFVTRSDTASDDETPLATRVERVRAALEAGTALISFDPEHQQAILVLRREVPAQELRDFMLLQGDQ